MIGSALDGIPGLGKARKIRLLQEFGSIQKVQQATLEDLQSLSWLPAAVAFEIHNKFTSPEKTSGG